MRKVTVRSACTSGETYGDPDGAAPDADGGAGAGGARAGVSARVTSDVRWTSAKASAAASLRCFTDPPLGRRRVTLNLNRDPLPCPCATLREGSGAPGAGQDDE